MRSPPVSPPITSNTHATTQTASYFPVAAANTSLASILMNTNHAGTGGGSGGAFPHGNGIHSVESLKEVFFLRSSFPHLQGMLLVFAFTLLATAAFLLLWRISGVLITRKAVFRSQSRARKKSRLDQATTASPSVSDESSPSGNPAVASSSTTTTAKPEPGSSASAQSSYPFPQMQPQRSISSSVNASFGIAMSPGTGPHDRPLPSGNSTPASFAFQPQGTQPITPFENPDFPTPNMYELALLLHSEAGIDAFWSKLVKIATTSYKAERVTLSVPSDLTDLENTPWGQKATFNVAEDDCFSLTYIGDGDGEGGVVGNQNELDMEDDAECDDSIMNEKSIESMGMPVRRGSRDRSSQQGDDQDEDFPELGENDQSSEGPFAPVTIGLSDPHDHETASNSDWLSETSGLSPLEPPQPPPLPPEFRRQGSGGRSHMHGMDEDEVRGRVFSTLQPLTYEADALLDGAGVSRVLQRGKTVVLSREYRDVKSHLEEREKRRKEAELAAGINFKTPSRAVSGEAIATDKNSKNSTASPKAHGLGKLDLSSTTPNIPSYPPTPLHFVGKGRGKRRSVPRGDVSQVHNPMLPFCSSQQHLYHMQSRPPSSAKATNYEEYEQALTSPWSQSPAPSPAPKQDPSENPFFAPPKVDEETFNPAASSPVYSAQEQVNAIGLESAWTVIHIPLIHPSLSKTLRPSAPATGNASAASMAPQGREPPFRGGISMPGCLLNYSSNGAEPKKAPIAILSMLSPVIPYPSNLVQSLSHFAPLVATAFSLAQSHTNALNQLEQLSHMRHRRFLRKQPTDIESLITSSSNGHRSMETGGGDTASLTSPSEISSTMSKPGSSVGSRVPSPGWDFGTMSRSTTAGSDRGSVVSPNNGRVTTPLSPVAGEEKAPEGYFPQPKQRRKIFSRQNSGGVETVETVAALGNHVERLIPSLEMQLEMEDEEGTSSGGTVRARRRVAGGGAGSLKKRQKSVFRQPSPMRNSFTAEEEDESHARVADSQNAHNYLNGEDILDKPGFISSAASSPTIEQAHHKRQRTVPRRRKTVRKLSGHGHHSHTLLHSYGADYSATFQSLAGTTSIPGTPSGRRPGSSSSSRVSGQHLHEMPPPSNKLLRTIIDSIPVHVFTAAPHTGETTWVNARMLAYRGMTVEEFMKGPWDAFHVDDRDEYVKRWSIAVRKGEPFSHQVRVRRFDGTFRWFMIRAVPLRDSRGIIVHWFGTNMDIHDQRLAEVNAARQAEMAESESKYRSLANSSPQIVFAATADEGITYANTQWLEYSGQTLQEALNLGFMEHVHALDRSKCSLPEKDIDADSSLASPADNPSNGPTSAAENARWIRNERMKKCGGEGSFSTELRLKDKNGKYRWHLVRCVSVETNFGNGEGLWFGTCTDINDQKLLEQKLKEANEAAQKTMESKTRFLANMSHEIRTPLIGISGMVNFLLDTPLNGEQLDYCHTISQSSDGLLSVINDILDLSKVEAGMMRMNPEWFRIHSLIEDANELLSTMAIAKDLELNFIVDDEVPPVVCGDRVRLRQVLLNVIGNAIKFTSEGEVFSKCSVVKDAEVGENEVMLEFECHDTGPGFDKKEEELMFKPFSQIDGSSTRAHGGSGLGLVISRQLVELHGGEMTASSEKGKGSTFNFSAKFRIPSNKEDANSSATVTSETTTPGRPEGPEPSIRRPEQRIYESKAFSESPEPMDSQGSNHIGEPASGTPSSASSVPSVYSSVRSSSGGSSVSSAPHAPSPTPDPSSIHLALPTETTKQKPPPSNSTMKTTVVPIARPLGLDVGRTLIPPMFSILIVSEQHYSRIAIAHHIKVTLPKNIPNQIAIVSDYTECKNLISGEDPVVFTHVVINLQDHMQIISLISQILESPIHSQTTILVLTNPAQRTTIIQDAPPDCESEKMGSRLQFIYKPIKSSRFGATFDPAKERDASTDRNRDSAQQVVESQKRVFSQMEKEVGNRGLRVLLVEDNRVNQKVLLRFLDKVGLEVETAVDGEECVEKVFTKRPGYYGLVLCDLHMPRKDGFQACEDIRQWERENDVENLMPIVALSANVMSDVAGRCVDAGFSRYVSKPVDFKELSTTIKDLLMDPDKSNKLMEAEPSSPPPGMRSS